MRINYYSFHKYLKLVPDINLPSISIENQQRQIKFTICLNFSLIFYKISRFSLDSFWNFNFANLVGLLTCPSISTFPASSNNTLLSDQMHIQNDQSLREQFQHVEMTILPRIVEELLQIDVFPSTKAQWLCHDHRVDHWCTAIPGHHFYHAKSDQVEMWN